MKKINKVKINEIWVPYDTPNPMILARKAFYSQSKFYMYHSDSFGFVKIEPIRTAGKLFLRWAVYAYYIVVTGATIYQKLCNMFCKWVATIMVNIGKYPIIIVAKTNLA
jgi:hypothetical protein